MALTIEERRKRKRELRAADRKLREKIKERRAGGRKKDRERTRKRRADPEYREKKWEYQQKRRAAPEYREKERGNQQKWRAENPEKVRGYRKKHPEYQESTRKWSARTRENLADPYVRHCLKMANPGPKLMELKRMEITLYRILKQGGEALKNGPEKREPVPKGNSDL